MCPLIITVCGDPGGASALLPILQLMQKEKHVQLINYVYNQAVDVFKNHQMNGIILPVDVSRGFALDLLKKNQTALVLTATSINGKDWERLFISIAWHLKINSLAVLDFWSNYLVRFDVLPDKIAVMDEYAKVEAIRDGIPEEKIIVTGQPAFDALNTCRNAFDFSKKREIRTILKAADSDLLILFASQPQHSVDYDSHSTLSQIIPALEQISHKHNKKIFLLIRPHPREATVQYQAYHSDRIKIVVSMEGDQREYVMAVDLVLGMTSVLLVEACYLQCIVLSFQLGLRQADILPTNRWGASIPIYRESDVMPMLEKYLLDCIARKDILEKTPLPFGTASRQIVDYVYSLQHLPVLRKGDT